jgi:hypothetical protein
MVNTRVKGWAARREVMEWFKLSGGDAGVCERTGRFIKDKDLFGLFDIVAYDYEADLYFVQITNTRPHTHKPFIEFSKKKLDITTLQLVRLPQKKWQAFVYYNGDKSVHKGTLDEVMIWVQSVIR